MTNKEKLKELEELKKACMYSKDNYTDEDRKVLCDGCEEECKFNKKEEPVNEDFEAEVKKLWMEINTGHSYSIVDSYNIFYGLCMDIADWQKQKDANLIFNAKEDGYRLGLATMKQQLMKEAISGHVGQTINGMLRVLSDEIFGDMGFTAGDKVKLIIIKQE